MGYAERANKENISETLANLEKEVLELHKKFNNFVHGNFEVKISEIKSDIKKIEINEKDIKFIRKSIILANSIWLIIWIIMFLTLRK
jgi:septum formation topological specificity factor MinE